ncbi:AAA family ATPase [bacterium]|nr:AAA family ATPase [bacterium]
MVRAVCNGYYIEILPENFCSKEKINKPFIEPDYSLFDAKIGSLSSSFEIFLEIELKEEKKKLKVKKYLSDCSKKTIYYGKNEDYDSIIAKKLGIKSEDFKFSVLLEEVLEEYQEKMLEINKQTGKKFLYEPFILDSSPVVLCSPMGTGKTLFAIWLAYRIQNGIPLIQNEEKIYNYEHYKSKVLYLAFEGSKEEITEKIESIKNYYKQNEKIFLGQEIEDFMLIFFPYTFYKSVVRKKIRKAISIYNPDLIIFDSITSALMTKCELKQAEYIFDYIKNVLEPRGIASLLIMHPSKQDIKEENPMPKGSILYMTYPRIVWYLEQTGEFLDGFELKLKSIKDNLGLKKNSYKFEVHFEENLCDFRLTEIIDETRQNKKIADYCLEYLQIHKKAKANEIAEYYKLSYDSVNRILNRLVNRGIIVKFARGVFALKEEEKEESKENKEPTIIKGNSDNIPF